MVKKISDSDFEPSTKRRPPADDTAPRGTRRAKTAKAPIKKAAKPVKKVAKKTVAKKSTIKKVAKKATKSAKRTTAKR